MNARAHFAFVRFINIVQCGAFLRYVCLRLKNCVRYVHIVLSSILLLLRFEQNSIRFPQRILRYVRFSILRFIFEMRLLFCAD